jgi:UDP-N-acetylglucosamine--dolichyl-phosphate N-acetylglucosaminephosphotransferase
MISLLLALPLSFISAFFVASAVLPFIEKRMLARGICGVDMNKPDKPKIAEMGGTAVWLGLSAGILVAIFLFSYFNGLELDLTLLLAGFSTIMLVGFLGVIDDLVGWKNGLRQWQHALIPVFAALPLMAVKASNPPMLLPFVGYLPAEYAVPFIGIVSFGTIYSLFLVPLGVTGASNATNMLAGLNGLEAGLGAIITATLLAISFAGGMVESAIIAAAMLAALLAFLRYNWFPARIFGGDSLTMMIGAGFATIAILGNMEMIAVLLMLLYFVELVLKARHRFQAESFGVPTKEGFLLAPKKSGSLTHVVMGLGRFNEKKVVGIILGMQALVSAFVFAASYFKLFRFLL